MVHPPVPLGCANNIGKFAKAKKTITLPILVADLHAHGARCFRRYAEVVNIRATSEAVYGTVLGGN